MKELAQQALDAATRYGASYADVRIVRHRRQNLNTEDHRVSNISDSEDVGIGVRVLVDGAWGFAGSGGLTSEEAQRVAAQAVAIARASASAIEKPVQLVPEPPRRFQFRTPSEVDPFRIAIDEKVGLLLAINRE